MNKETRIKLRGMTWDHPRGWQPLEACSATWERDTGVSVTWDRRSLQDFESFPVEELARAYDLIVIDHPHVGQVFEESCLVPLPVHDPRLAAIAKRSVGQSYTSYFWRGQQWAIPIDAASQVQAWRSDLLAQAPRDWQEVLALARQGRVAIPLRAPHALMALFTLVGQLGAPARVEGPRLFEMAPTCHAVEHMKALMALIDPKCLEQDPIATFEDMARSDARISCAPLIFGYVNYAYLDFRPARLSFADIPTFDGRAPVGAVLGGTGLAISARSAHQREAIDFAIWAASEAVQAGAYAHGGGQPNHTAAWEADDVHQRTNGFYRATRATLDGAWVRPRHNGYMPFQDAGSRRLLDGLRIGEASEAIVEALNRMYQESLAA